MTTGWLVGEQAAKPPLHRDKPGGGEVLFGWPGSSRPVIVPPG